ncbi:MAG TPA: prepilin-type N-terminal cleavage/methylation domain-containing protein [Armatimonadota bacterium]|jgi:prepilin-type N-terminal cleavage/methylation domain-containing protein
MLALAHRGFTLIELLVVICIIAMLASLLMPAFTRARASAHEVVCASNQRQIALETMLYNSDHQEKYPDKADVWGALGVMPKLLQCPTRGEEIQRAYVFSSFVAGKSLGSISYPSSEILTADGKIMETTQNAPALLEMATDVDMRHAANLGTLASFCDGHVAMVKELPPMWMLDMPACYGGLVQPHYGYYYEFDYETVLSSYPSLAFFYTNDGSPQAAYCARLKTVIREVAKAYRLFARVTMVNGAKLPALATRFAIDPASAESGYPTLLFFKNQQQQYAISGCPADTSAWTELDWAQEMALVKQQITDRLDTLVSR